MKTVAEDQADLRVSNQEIDKINDDEVKKNVDEDQILTVNPVLDAPHEARQM